MAVVKELIRTEADGSISFGNYELAVKSKVSDFEHEGDLYKVKTFREITKLERNGMFVYESVPGTAVTNLAATENGVSFTVEGENDAQITVELEEDTEYEITIGNEIADRQKTNLGGKLSFSVELAETEEVPVRIEKITQE
ncbi:MAG: endosialidase [Lachnospiraceae bacterium]|nr:endosialidase [Lachnospiraceae bacterium]